MTMSDLITLIFEILLLICVAGLGFGLYVWYLDHLWMRSIEKGRKSLYMGLRDVSDVEYRDS